MAKKGSQLEGSNSSESSDEGLTMGSNNNVVFTWLQFLQMEQYANAFFDNGYDDMETVKQIGAEDLDAIGVVNSHHRAFLLDAVKVLREQGAVWVYLLQQENRHHHQQQQQQQQQMHQQHQHHHHQSEYDRVSAGSSGIASANSSSIPWNDHDHDFATSTSGENSSSSSSSRPRSKVSVGNPQATTSSRPRSSPGSSRSSNSPALGSTQRCLVELTPKHHRATKEKQQIPSEEQRQRQPQQQHQQPQPVKEEDEDLIQRVSDIALNSKTLNSVSSSSSSASTGLQNAPTSSNAATAELIINSSQQQQRLCKIVREKLVKEGISLSAPPFSSKTGDGYLFGLASRYSQELGVTHSEILAQLEGLRLAEWSQVQQIHPAQAAFVPHQLQFQHHRVLHTYANLLPTESRDSLTPGIYASSSCLSDKEEEDIYDFAANYDPRSSSKPLTSPQGWYQIAKRVICRNPKDDLYSTISNGGSPMLSQRGGTAALRGGFTRFRSSTPNNTPLTRTRLRPGGPDHRVINTATMSRNTMRNGSLPTMSNGFEDEIAMKTLAYKAAAASSSNNKNSMFPVSSAFYGTMGKPATPLVKQRTTGCASPRVQMYRTRVVYSGDHQVSANLHSTAKSQEAAV